MGGIFGKVMSKLVGKKDVRILMVGLVRAAALGLAFPGVLAHPAGNPSIQSPNMTYMHMHMLVLAAPVYAGRRWQDHHPLQAQAR